MAHHNFINLLIIDYDYTDIVRAQILATSSASLQKLPILASFNLIQVMGPLPDLL
jgi:hypothetical protein